MKHLRKSLSIAMTGVVLLGLFSFTGCSFFKSTNESQGFSPIRLEKLEDTVDTVVEEYFMEKYGVEATVTYKNVAGNVFLGPDPSSIQYYNVTVNIADGDIDNKYYVEVHGREAEEIDELYVKSDAYYYKAVLWALEKGITVGTTATTFSPNNDCTRAQIATSEIPVVIPFSTAQSTAS